MFGFSRLPTISADDAVSHFIGDVLRQSESSFEAWLTTIVRGLAIHRVPPEVSERILNSRNMKQVFFCTTCAMEASAIRNCFDADNARLLYQTLDRQLTSTFSGSKKIAAKVSALLVEIQEHLADRSVPPERALGNAVASSVMKQMDLSAHDATVDLVDSPIFVMTVLGACMEFGFVGWWKALGKKAKLTVA